jgi:UDP-glucuronate 4-epimerase
MSDKIILEYGVKYDELDKAYTEIEKDLKGIEKASEKELFKEFVDAQSGDVVTTYADTSKLENRVNYKPCFPLEIGIKNFVDWFKSYYSL